MFTYIDKPRLRSAAPDDYSNFVEFLKEVYRDGTGLVPTLAEGLSVDILVQEKKWVCELSQLPENLLVLAISKDTIIGNLDFRAGTHERERHRGRLGMAVHPNWRGQGIGTELMSFFSRWLENNKMIAKVELSVFSSNKPAVKLYEKFGFRKEGLREKSFRYSDGAFDDEILMGKLCL